VCSSDLVTEILLASLKSSRENRTVDVLRDAQARGKEIENAMTLRDEGYLSHGDSALLLGIDG